MKKIVYEVHPSRGEFIRALAVSIAVLIGSAVFSPKASAQTSGITFNKEDATVKEALDAIKQQTGLSAVFEAEDVDLQRKVTIHANDSNLDSVLRQLFRGTGVSYVVNQSHIVLTTTPAQKSQDSRQIGIRGVVTDQAGAPLAGVTILVQGSARGTVTLADGSYSLDVHPGESLLFTYMGYEHKTVPVSANNTTINVVLAETITQMESVVVTAMGIKRQEKALAYSVQQVSGENVTTVKDANFMNSLAGKVAGVTINSSASGAGAQSRVVMRGTKSLTGSNIALYVIDGIPVFNVANSGEPGLFVDQGRADGISDINPEDIESINILTGPSAAALYGQDASSGVVLINTKKGQKDKTSLTVSNSTIFSMPYIMPIMQNRYVNEPGNLESWGAQKESSYDPSGFFNTGVNLINSISFMTGNQRNQTYASVSTTNTTGILPNTEYDRYNFSMRNTSTFLKDKLTLDMSGNFIIQHDQNMTTQGQYQNPLLALYLFPRGDNFDEVRNFERYNFARGVYEQYWPYTNAGLSLQNPYWIVYRNLRNDSKKRYMFNASLKYQILDWMDVTARGRVDNTVNRYTYKKYATTDPIFAGEAGAYDDRSITHQSFYGDVMLNINKRWNDWSLMANIGSAINDMRYEMLGHSGNLREANPNLFAVHNLDYVTKYKPKQDGWHDQIQSLFASVEVGWRSMLYLTLTGRNDWDSRLGGSNQTSFFYPSAGLSAVVTEMIDTPDWLSYLKLRGSYSDVGSSYDRYMLKISYPFSEEAKEYETEARYPMYDLYPEKTKSWETGLNIRLFNKISLDFTYYRSNTINQTFNVRVSAAGGWSHITLQSGKVRNQGVELGVGYRDKWNEFSFETHYNFTWNQNRVIRLGGGATNPLTGEIIEMKTWEQSTLGNLDARIVLKEGGSMGDVYASHMLATDTNGDIKVNPQKGTLEIANKEVKLGSILPDFNMGWSNDFGYKGLQLGMTFAARIGGIALSGTESILGQYGVSKATADARDNGGVPINAGKVDPKIYYQTIAGYAAYYTYSATNLRLQELSLGYMLPPKWFNDKMNMTVSLVGRNLWMIYCKAPFDPELSGATADNYYQSYDYFMLPSTRNLGFSVRFQF